MSNEEVLNEILHQLVSIQAEVGKLDKKLDLVKTDLETQIKTVQLDLMAHSEANRAGLEKQLEAVKTELNGKINLTLKAALEVNQNLKDYKTEVQSHLKEFKRGFRFLKREVSADLVEFDERLQELESALQSGASGD